MRNLWIIALLASRTMAASLSDLSWESSEEGLIITACESSAQGVMDIPEEISGQRVIKIAPSAFFDCDNLTKITLPETISHLGANAFDDCYSLQTINIPSSITIINPETFRRCGELQEITIPAGVVEIGDRAFDSCTSLAKANLPESLARLGESAFHLCISLENINLPARLTTIDTRAFDSCRALKALTIPEGITVVQDFAFAYCRALETVNLPNSLREIREGAFTACEQIQDLAIPDGVTHIGSSAFKFCRNAVGLALPGQLEFLGDQAFQSCDQLSSVTIPSSLATIGSGAFSYCISLEEIVVADEHASLRAINGVLFDKELTTIVQYPGGKQDPQYEIPEGVLAFQGTGCFASNAHLERVVIPEGFTEVGDWGFVNCLSLQEVELPQSLEVVGYVVFSNCPGLERITIPRNVTTIHNGAFTDSFNLREVVFEGPATNPTNGRNAFRNTASGALALVRPEYANSFGPVGSTWKGLEIRIQEPGDTGIIPPGYLEQIASTNFSGPEAAFEADPQNRGISNGLSHALGISLSGPLTPEQIASLPSLRTDEGRPHYFRISLPAALPLDLDYSIVRSNDLTNWEEVYHMSAFEAWGGDLEPEITRKNDQIIATFPLPPHQSHDNPRTFLRLRVVMSPDRE